MAGGWADIFSGSCLRRYVPKSHLNNLVSVRFLTAAKQINSPRLSWPVYDGNATQNTSVENSHYGCKFTKLRGLDLFAKCENP